MGRALRSIFDDGIGELRFKAAAPITVVLNWTAGLKK